MAFKIYDCSNSPDRPPHRGGGPVTNDVMRYLKENCEDYYIEFTNDLYKADVVLTNDVFPERVLETDIPLVKRMCGPFWHEDYIHRNVKLNEAARLADKVIFISEYSKEQYIHFYGMDLKSSKVVTHWVDPNVYFNTDGLKKDVFTLAAIATNWNRKEKRLSEIIRFANMYPEVEIMLIGTAECEVPPNVKKFGYVEDPLEMSSLLNFAHGFLNLSYRDAATKTVPQAISCGLPVLYSNSGGVIELAGEYGTDIKDDMSLEILDHVPALDPVEIDKGYKQFRKDFEDIQIMLETFDRKLAFRRMLDGYFEAIVETVPLKEDERIDI